MRKWVVTCSVYCLLQKRISYCRQPDAVSENIPPFNKFSRIMLRWRSYTLPPNPRTLSQWITSLDDPRFTELSYALFSTASDAVVDTPFYRRLQSDTMVLFVSEKMLPYVLHIRLHSIMYLHGTIWNSIFGTQRTFRALTQNDVIISLDGTFECVPNVQQAKQLVTIMATKDKNVRKSYYNP